VGSWGKKKSKVNNQKSKIKNKKTSTISHYPSTLKEKAPHFCRAF
jgi:hypothetical protein